MSLLKRLYGPMLLQVLTIRFGKCYGCTLDTSLVFIVEGYTEGWYAFEAAHYRARLVDPNVSIDGEVLSSAGSIAAVVDFSLLDGINVQVLNLFVAGVGATAVAASFVALVLQAVSFPVGVAIIAVGGVVTALGGFGFFKYSPDPVQASAQTAPTLGAVCHLG